MYVQYGCGWCAPDSWINFDASLTLRFERIPLLGRFYTKNAARFPDNVRYGDIVRGLPLPPGSCRGVYASHVLEHLALADADRALANTKRLLRSGGIFRLVVPDLSLLARRYLESASEDAAMEFMESSGLGRRSRSFLKDWLGKSHHVWMWDAKSLTKKLREHGFANIRPASFGDAEDPMFREVEERGRFEEAVAIQCST